MKRYLSVIGLAAQSSFWKGLALIVLSAALAGLLLYIAPESVPVHYVDENGEEQTYEDTISPSELPSTGKVAAPLAMGFGGLCSILARTGGGKGAKTGYTMQRLRVKKRTACLLWTAYDFMMLVLFWAVAALTVLAVMSLRVKNYTGSEAGPQTLIFAFYESSLLHHLLPMGDVLSWVGNVTMALACAVACVNVAYAEWKGKMAGVPLGMAAMTMISFRVSVAHSSYMFFYIVGEVIFTGIILYSWLGGEEDGEKEPEAGHS